MTKAEAFGRWLAQNPAPAKMIGWAVLIALLGLALFGIWFAVVGGKKVGLFVSGAVAICFGLKTYRQARKTQNS